jgi:hypothetical protein
MARGMLHSSVPRLMNEVGLRSTLLRRAQIRLLNPTLFPHIESATI